jgi:hypothetical protein
MKYDKGIYQKKTNGELGVMRESSNDFNLTLFRKGFYRLYKCNPDLWIKISIIDCKSSDDRVYFMQMERQLK